MTSPDGDSFEWDLGRFLLLAYATGDPVEGSWVLLDPHQMVPDIEVVVDRVDRSSGAPAFDEHATTACRGSPDFKGRLHRFVLEQFSRGSDIDGEWRVRFARMDLPKWNVRITSNVDEPIASEDDEVSSLR